MILSIYHTYLYTCINLILTSTACVYETGLPNLRFQPCYSLVRGLVQLYRWRHVNVIMTKEPYVVNNLLLFTVLSYDVTVDSWQSRHDCLGAVPYCHLEEVGRSSVGGSKGWTSTLQSGSMSIINSLMERKRGCGSVKKTKTKKHYIFLPGIQLSLVVLLHYTSSLYTHTHVHTFGEVPATCL